MRIAEQIDRGRGIIAVALWGALIVALLAVATYAANAGTLNLVPTCSSNCLTVSPIVPSDPPSFEFDVHVKAPTFEQALAEARRVIGNVKGCASFSTLVDDVSTWVACKIPKQAPLTDAELARLRLLIQKQGER